MERYICIHGHFYQPPRENAWLEYIESQDSAYPFHDWNERITAECYGPNGMSRILDPDGNIASITNNYSRISFNFGRIFAGISGIAVGTLTPGGYAKMGAIVSLIYIAGLALIWLAPETKGRPLPE